MRRLVETRLDGHHHDDLEEPGWRVLPAGHVATCASGCIHALSNFDDTLALSIHVYSPLLNTLGFYRHDEGHVVASWTQEVTDDRVSLW